MQLWSALQKVYRTRTMTEEDYFSISRWASAAYFIALTVTFGISMYLVGNNVEKKSGRPPFQPSPWDFSTLSSILHLGTFAITITLVIVLTSISIWKREYPLVKARGLPFIVGLGVSSFLALIGVLMGLVGVYWYNVRMAPKWYQYIRLLLVMGGTASILSLLATRQAFLYYIFVRYPFSQRSHRRNLSLIYLLCMTPAIVYAILLAENMGGRLGKYSRLVRVTPYAPPLLVLLFYAWRSRNISTGFGHLESYARLGVVLMISMIVSAVVVLYLPSAGKGPPIWNLLIIEYERMWMVAVTLCELLMTVSALALLNIKPQDRLHPKNTQITTFQKAVKPEGSTTTDDNLAVMITPLPIESMLKGSAAELDKKPYANTLSNTPCSSGSRDEREARVLQAASGSSFEGTPCDTVVLV